MRNTRYHNKNGIHPPSEVITHRGEGPKKRERKPKDKLHGNRIKAILDEIGMSQEELADLAVDGNAPFMSRIINGDRQSISLPTAFRISRVLKRPIEEIFIYREEDVIKKNTRD